MDTFEPFYHESMKGIQEISFFLGDLKSVPRVRGRGMLPLAEYRGQEATNVLEKVVSLDVSDLNRCYIFRLLYSLSPNTKKNITILNVDGFMVTQNMLDQFPNIRSLTIGTQEKGLHLKNNILINKLCVYKCIPLIEPSRYIEVSYKITDNCEYIYSGNLAYSGGGFSGVVTIELTKREMIHVSNPFQEEMFMRGKRRAYIVTGELRNGKAVGSFTKRTKGLDDTIVIERQQQDDCVWNAIMRQSI